MVYGFSLKDKIWGGFAVSNTSDIEWDEFIFDALVLSKAQKRLIRTLVLSHISQTSGFDDIVREKGRGLVGLLSGPPGVGKTLTAEAVAEVVRRPLYVLSSGELGPNSTKLDHSLQKVLELAQTWGAVLLLDEADVFLAKRDDHDLDRNAVVSIFPRQLEYYQGILIMTTNRVESIDAAFQSKPHLPYYQHDVYDSQQYSGRIHFCYEYPELDLDARKLVWSGFLQRIRKHPTLEVRIEDNEMDELGASRLNGRQVGCFPLLCL